ncbi:MAG: hypothetical protein JXR03_12255 [Cyclobacteriaceae bacterium]
MELDKTENILHVATGDYDIVKELLDKFNSIYKTNMKYQDSVDVDGVMFSYIDINGATIDKVFLFGSMFGSKIRELRDSEEIDW